MEQDADPEFLELSERQRAAIDRAFERGLQRPSKRRRLTRKEKASARSTPAGGFLADEDEGAGGFIPDDDAGGFIPDDGAGGFLPDDEAGGFMPSGDEGGGFVVDEPSSAPTAAGTPAERVPIGRVPALLASLGLPSDEDVLSVFRASAAGWEDDSEGSGGSVSLKDWRAVCAALMTPGDDEALQDEAEEGNFDDEELSSLSSDEDDFVPSAEEGDEEGGSDYGKKSASATPAPRRRQKRQAKSHLSSQQKELGRDIWDMLKPQGGSTLSKDEVKKWAREMGEMWSDDEITDMVTMFAGGATYLSFDQFCTVLLRAGLV